MTTSTDWGHPETQPIDPTPPGRPIDRLHADSTTDPCDPQSLVRARELLAVIKGLVERLEEHLDELG
jgi:hypothetical protein